jgi:hypothetical protein
MTRWRTFYAIRQHDHLARVCVVEVYKDAPSRRRQPGTPRQFEDQMTASRAYSIISSARADSAGGATLFTTMGGLTPNPGYMLKSGRRVP